MFILTQRILLDQKCGVIVRRAVQTLKRPSDVSEYGSVGILRESHKFLARFSAGHIAPIESINSQLTDATWNCAVSEAEHLDARGVKKRKEAISG